MMWNKAWLDHTVLYWDRGKYHLGYDLLVVDSPLNPEWICYESLPDEVRYNAWNLEREMFRVLDRAVEQFDLSYTECRFPVIYPNHPMWKICSRTILKQIMISALLRKKKI